MIGVVIVDDDALMRAGLRMILEQADDMTVVGEASDGAEARIVVSDAKPEIVLMDVRMPEMDGITATARILDLPSPPKVVALTTFELDDYVFDALAAGASGFLLKRTRPEQLVEAIRVVVAGGAMLSPSVTTRVIEQFARPPRPSAAPSWLNDLTGRERDVLRAMARGLSNAEIAEQLFIGENTVKTHVGRVFAKLGARDRARAVVLAFQAGLVAWPRPEGGPGRDGPRCRSRRTGKRCARRQPCRVTGQVGHVAPDPEVVIARVRSVGSWALGSAPTACSTASQTVGSPTRRRSL